MGCPVISYCRTISIHAFREEGDDNSNLPGINISLFLSTPSVRRATRGQQKKPFRGLFLSAPSARRATFAAQLSAAHLQFLSAPSARRATGWSCFEYLNELISIHALREEGD